MVIANTSGYARRPYHLETMPLAAISQRGAEAIGCHVNETTMISGAIGWSDGVERWRLYHDGGQESIHHLEVSGGPPHALAAIDHACREKQARDTQVDYVFDTPLDLACAIVGFRHDRTPEDARWFERLARV